MEFLSLLLEAIDWGPDTINTVLGLVPERYRANVEAVLALMTSLALALAAWRKLMARFAPRASNHPVVVLLDRVLHVFAGNSVRLEARTPVVRERLSGAPRQPTIMPPRGEP